LAALSTVPVYGDSATSADLTHLSIEELMNLQVVSTAKQAQRLADAAAAIFVITQEDIRRSGVTSIPEVLRLVPGVQVTRIAANQWAITARGFNSPFANKLLVLIDGRSVYTPIFSGVYWEIQDLLLEDIERIEVIRGPGASLWGANAVNGVINIFTKHAADTQGGLFSLSAGNQEQAILGLRYGGKLGEDGYYRLYGKYLNEAPLVDNQGSDANDNWRLGSGGFRLDWTPSSRHAVTVQGDLYSGDLNQNLTVPSFIPPYVWREQDTAQISGGNLQALWQYTLSPSSQLNLQAYYQRDKRQEALQDGLLNTFDVDFQHSFFLDESHNIVWGLNYRLYSDDFRATELSSLSPTGRRYDLFSGFIQDQISLLPERLTLTLGTKLERNDFTGWEFQPSARLLWAFHPKHRLWSAVSHAVRTPSRGESDSRLNLFVIPPLTPGGLPNLIVGEGRANFASEKLAAYELGYRTWPNDRLSLDLTAFYNDYDNLFDVAPGTPILERTMGAPHLTIPLLLNNQGNGKAHGIELAVDWHPLNRWRLQLAYSYLQAKRDIQSLKGSVEVSNGTNPRHQLSLRSSFDIRDDWELDLWLRYVDKLNAIRTLSPLGFVAIDAYLTVDLRLGWRPQRNLELSLVGANLLNGEHLEFIRDAYPFPTQVERSFYGQLRWSF
jgi:iron complex outermembrane receptor protein